MMAVMMVDSLDDPMVVAKVVTTGLQMVDPKAHLMAAMKAVNLVVSMVESLV